MTNDTKSPTAVKASWATARLSEPSPNGYLILALSTGSWHIPPALPRARRRELLAQLADLAAALSKEGDVLDASVFRGFVRPPGDRPLTGQWSGPVTYDAILLVQTTTPDIALNILHDKRIRTLAEQYPGSLGIAGLNLRRIADVDHQRKGVFLFNFFTADNIEDNLHAWQYTAGWFQDETGLDNSTVVGNLTGDSPFSLINHCRWDSLADVLPSLLFKRSFRRFVLETFSSHRVAPHPALYRLYYSSAAA